VCRSQSFVRTGLAPHEFASRNGDEKKRKRLLRERLAKCDLFAGGFEKNIKNKTRFSSENHKRFPREKTQNALVVHRAK